MPAGPSTPTIFVPPPGSLGCNTAAARVEAESLVRILSTDNAGSALGVRLSSGTGPLAFPNRV
jgi:hypothetical protein